jgi:hypothetical protein
MRRLSSFLSLPFFFILLAFPALTFPADRGIGGIRLSLKQGQSLYLYKDYHALVIGISDYEKWPKLPNAVLDAKEVASKLEELGFNVKVVLNPGSREMKAVLGEMVYEMGTEENRALLLYYAGHGETETLADQTKLGYIVPKDCPLLKQDPMGFANHAISMKDIESISMRIKAKHVIMLFDSCFSGSLFTLVRAVPDHITEKSALPVRQYITAGSEDEQVPDRSMFKRAFLIGLEGDADLTGDGYVTGTELGMYLSDKVVTYTHRSQHPQYGKINNPDLDRGDFVFVVSGKSEAKLHPGKVVLGKDPAEAKSVGEKLARLKPEAAQSPPGAPVAEAGFPPVGTRTTYRIFGEEGTYKRTFTVIEDAMFKNRRVHQLLIEQTGKINMYDSLSKNWMGQIADGKVARLAKPHTDLFRFPLYVGKEYESTYFLSKPDWSGNITERIEVEAFEKVMVPAGTFETFRIKVVGKGVKKTFWYSPDLHVCVKRRDEHRRKGTTGMELIAYKRSQP